MRQHKSTKFQNEPKTVQHYTSDTNQYQPYASQNHSNLNQDQSTRFKQPKKVWCVKNVKFDHGKPTSLLLFQTWNQFNYLEFLVLNFARFWPPPIYVCLIQNNFSVERNTGTWLKELLGWFGCKTFLKYWSTTSSSSWFQEIKYE